MDALKVVVDASAKLGHYCPRGCGSAQLYASDAGLACPVCHTVYVAKDPEPAKGRKPKE